MIKIMHDIDGDIQNDLVWNARTCIHFDSETLIDGQGTCLLWDDAPFKCIGWLSDNACCIDYEIWACYGLEKLKDE